MDLWAKSQRNGRVITLAEHLATERVAARLFTLDKRWGRNWCRFFRLTDAPSQQAFLLHLRLAALLHDLGKANEGFQDAVRGRRDAQVLRHEHLGALLFSLPDFKAWLSANPAIDVDVIAAAVLSHHTKASEGAPLDWGQPQGLRNRIGVHFDHPDVVPRTIAGLV